MRYIRIDASAAKCGNFATLADPFAESRNYRLVDLANSVASGTVQGGGNVTTDDLPHHEFSTILQGEIAFEGRTGARVTFLAGDSFVMPAGLSGSFSASGNMSRSFLICGQDIEGSMPKHPVAIDLTGERTRCPGPSAELLLTSAPDAFGAEAYRSPNGRFQAGVWQCGAFDRKPALARNYELMQIVEGEATLQNAGLHAEPYLKGESVLIHPGICYVLRARETFAKVYAIVTPTAA